LRKFFTLPLSFVFIFCILIRLIQKSTDNLKELFMNVLGSVKKFSVGGMFIGALVVASSLTFTGCLTDDDPEPTKPSAKDSTVVKTGTVGAQSNTTAGSFVELDTWQILLSDAVTSALVTDIDLVFAYSTSQNAAAFYSPDSAAGGIGGSAGFDFAKAKLGTSGASTDMRKINATTFDGIKTTEDLEAAWTGSAAGNVKSRLVIANGDAFIAESTKGLKVAIKVTSLTATALGSAAIEGKAKW
jgi:hypothetical protein